MEAFVYPIDTLYLIGAMTVLGLLLQLGAIDGGGTNTRRSTIIMLVIGVFIAPLTWCAVMVFTTVTPASWRDAVIAIWFDNGSHVRLTLFAFLNIFYVGLMVVSPVLVAIAIWRMRKSGHQPAQSVQS